MQAYSAQPIGVTEELTARQILTRARRFFFDFGQNFAGNIRLRLKGEAAPSAHSLREMLHPDGRLMRRICARRGQPIPTLSWRSRWRDVDAALYLSWLPILSS